MPGHNDEHAVLPLPGGERSSAKQAGEGDVSPALERSAPLTLSLSPPGRGDQTLTSARAALEVDLATRAATLDADIGGLAPEAILREAVARFPGELALVSSFGAESAVLLHMAAGVDRHLPVVFVDTLRLFPETLAYRDRLVDGLGLTDVRTVGPERAVMEQADPWHALFNVDPDRCCHLRKVEPLAEALVPFTAWITGRKRYQAATRASLAVVEADATHIKISPLASWGAPEIAAYMRAHGLPVHPLVAQGYPSIGCAPCTTQVAPGEDARAGRWRGQGKVECGIHVGAAGTTRRSA